MIKINEKFSMEKDKYQWILHELREGKDKDGAPKQQKSTTFHSTINQACRAVIESNAGSCESMVELLARIESCIAVMTLHVETLRDSYQPEDELTG